MLFESTSYSLPAISKYTLHQRALVLQKRGVKAGDSRAEVRVLRETAKEVVAVNTKYGPSLNLTYAIAMLDAALKAKE